MQAQTQFLRCMVAALLIGPTTLGAADWFVATNGSALATGTRGSPWDISSAFEARHNVEPGDTVWFAGGVYKYPPKVGGQGFKINLAGTSNSPIHVRAIPGERVTIDGGLLVDVPATHLWIWDLEILVSEPRPDKPIPPDPTYRNVNRPWGGLNIQSGTGCKFINLVLHDNSQGASWWSGSKDSEIHGCIIYDNGWKGTDRGHGHAIYTQNQVGVKTISDCIMVGGFGYTMHAYGSSRAYVDNYVVERNICYDAGRFLIGGGKPSHHIQVYSNFLYNVSMQIGYSAPTNEDCIIRGNVIVNGDLQVLRYRNAELDNNLVLQKNKPRPAGTRVLLFPNKYDPRRANLAAFNWDRKHEVEADVEPFMKPGAKFWLLDPRNIFGAPVVSGTFQGRTIRIPMTNEFGAWVVMKNQ